MSVTACGRAVRNLRPITSETEARDPIASLHVRTDLRVTFVFGSGDKLWG